MGSAPRPPPSLDLVQRVTNAALAYTLTRLQVLERIPGNPIGVATRLFDGGAALMAQHLSSPSFNCAVGLRAGQADQIQPLVEWYRARGLPGAFEIAAGNHDPDLGRELARLGYFQSGFHAALIGEPGSNAALPSPISVDTVASAIDMEDFLTAYVAGWEIPEALQDQFKANVRPWLREPGWSLYLARVDGKPAATAILFVHSGVAYLADSATDPAFRKCGLHTALLRRRLNDASAAGVDFVCSGADFLSASHRNMERVGMRLLFLRAVWTPLATPAVAE